MSAATTPKRPTAPDCPSSPSSSTPKSKSLRPPGRQGALAKSESDGRLTPASRSPSFTGESIAHEVEKMTSEERESRGLHTPKVRAKLRTGTPVVEHVLVVGAPPARGPPKEYYTTGDLASVAPPEPKLLFQYPRDRAVDIVGIGNFCFPGGAVPQRRVRRNAQRVVSKAALSQLAPPAATRGRGASDPDRSLAADPRPQLENAFVFLLTSAEADIRYGVCVYREAVGYQTEAHYVVEQLAFVAITSAPFLLFHLEVLEALLAMPRVEDLPLLDEEALGRLVAEVVESLDPLPPHSEIVVTPPQEPRAPKPAGKLPVVAPASAPAAAAAAAAGGAVSRKYEAGPQGDAEFKKVLLTIAQYTRLRTPEAGGRLEFFVMSKPRPIAMTRPQWDEEAELLQEYGSLALFYVLPPRVVVWLLTAVLLEAKVVIVCSHKRLLSAVVLSLLPLVRPFSYLSPVIPIMPKSLLAYLDAPVPLIVGLTEPPPAHVAKTEGFLTINVLTGEVIGTLQMPELPNISTLRPRMEKVLKDLNIQPPEEGVAPEVPTRALSDPSVAQMQAPVVGGLFQSYMTELLMDFESYCISDVGSDLATVTVFMRDAFLESRPAAHRPFYNEFLNTQIFKVYEDAALRELDKRKTETRKNSFRFQHGTL
eukprot:m51a1_g4768 hypothetical protein (649) ;mRNA; f:15288-17368